MPIARQKARYAVLPQAEVGCLLERPAPELRKSGLVALGARAPHGGSFRAVQHPELDRRAIGHDTRVSAHRVDFADNLSLGYSAYGRVARHLRELGHIHRHQQRPATHIGRRRRRLASGVPASYHDNVEFEFHIAVRRRCCRYKVRRMRAVSSFVRKTVSGTGPPAFSSVAALRAACRRNRTGGVSRE